MGSMFRRFGFTIRVKLLIVTSVLVVSALGAMIYAAGQRFYEHSERLIQKYNLGMAQMIGLKLESDLRQISYQSRLLAGLVQEGETRRMERSARIFFESNPGIFFLGLSRPDADGLSFETGLFNQPFLRRNDLSPETVESHLRDSARLGAAVAGAPAMRNLSVGFGFPVLAIAMPLEDAPGSPVIVALMESTGFLENFQIAGHAELFDLFLVDESGQVLAHSDRELALSGGQAGQLPIVRTLLSSGNDNGSQRYRVGGNDYLGSFQLLGFGRAGVVSTIDADRAFEAVYLIQAENLKIMVLVLIVAFLFVYFFSRSLSAPIRRLVRATHQIEQGNFQVDIQATSRDEIGTLTNSFIDMARGLEERQKIKNTFGKFVNPQIVNLALQNELRFGGERRECAVLFCDLRNFTEMSESREPEEVLSILTEYFSHMVDRVHGRGGVVDKFIGDAIMAHWGALVTSENDTANAVWAALAMREALLELNREVLNDRGINLQFGVGINTGPVLAGQIGAETRLEYTVIGDTVNLASRIEYLNKHFGSDILISRASYLQVSDLFRFERMPPIQIKGKSKPETVYAVLGSIEDEHCPPSLHHLRERIGMDFDANSARAHLEKSSDVLVIDNRKKGPGDERGAPLS